MQFLVKHRVVQADGTCRPPDGEEPADEVSAPGLPFKLLFHKGAAGAVLQGMLRITDTAELGPVLTLRRR